MPAEKQRSSTFVELTLDAIDEGKLVEAVNDAIRTGIRDLQAYYDKHGYGDAMTISLSLKFKAKNDEGIMSIEQEVKKKMPTAKRGTTAFMQHGHAMVLPHGSSDDDPGQQRLVFDSHKRLIGKMDTGTGEIVDDFLDEDVAGKIEAG